MNYRLVLVEWADAYGCSPVWADLPEQAREHICHSVGWLVAESEHALVLVPHLSPRHDEIGAEEQGCGDMTIPKSAVRRLVDLAP